MVSGLPDWHGSINIAKQTLANVDMNINAQSLNYVRIKSLYGASYVVTKEQNISPGSGFIVANISGEGYMLYFLLDVTASADANKASFSVLINGNNVAGDMFSMLSAQGFTDATLPIKLLNYSSTRCTAVVLFTYALPYTTSLRVDVLNNSSSNSIHAYAKLVYTIV